MARLEGIVHPLVRAEEERFLAEALAAHAPVAVLDIPLLFETGGQSRCDAVLVVTAAPDVQHARVLAAARHERGDVRGHPREADAGCGEAPRRAHFLVDTGRGFPSAQRQVDGILRALASRPGRVLRPIG